MRRTGQPGPATLKSSAASPKPQPLHRILPISPTSSQFLTVSTEQPAPQTTSYAVAHGRWEAVPMWVERCKPKMMASTLKASAAFKISSLGDPNSTMNSGKTARLGFCNVNSWSRRRLVTRTSSRISMTSSAVGRFTPSGIGTAGTTCSRTSFVWKWFADEMAYGRARNDGMPKSVANRKGRMARALPTGESSRSPDQQ